MDKEINKRRKEPNKLINKSKFWLLITDEGASIKGSESEVLTLFTESIRILMKEANVDKEKIERSYKMAFMSLSELIEEVNKTIEKIMEEK